ncbi:MAG: 4-hydroxy-3-methylbut-2-enyl diphosphate reductase [Clostridia bacterium]|nr:4-hydroxy-3-methylbut-2-enyl diphosphate reductase [Clostridia bacterium]
MEVLIGNLCGFCPGVEYTVKKAEEALKENKMIYCLGEIVHNERVIAKLQDMGMITVKSVDDIPNNSKVIFRAHGEAKSIYERAKQKGLEVIDLTCGKVRIIHDLVEKQKESFIIIIGKKTHPETIGTKGFAKQDSFVIETEDDIVSAYEAYKRSKLNQIYIVEQTTFSKELFKELVNKIKDVFNESNITVENTICDATEKRQTEVMELSKKTNKMIIIGGKQSSNTKELYNIAINNCKEVYLIQEPEEIKNVRFNNDDIVGIMTGASTPKEIVEEVKQYLK